MGVLDFLFEGSPPPSTTTYGNTVENMPQWLSDYTQALIARANMVAAEPYQAYQGPRVAGFTDDQTNAFDVIRNNIGNWNDEFDASKTATGGAMSQAMPYFQDAAQSTPEAIQQYMDPYVGNVIDRAKLESNRNWQENIMPSISGRFIRGGQQGSGAHQDLLQKAGRDVTEGLNSQSLAALSDAYRTAGTQFSSDASRQANIGQSVGQMGLQAGSQLSGLAQLQQQMAGRDASSLSMVGDARQQQNQRNLDVAYGDFQAQRDYPRQQVDWMSSVIRGMPHDTTTNTSSTGPANAYQPSPLSQLISLYGLYKDVTDKAEGGVVRKKPDVSRLLAMIEDRDRVEAQARKLALRDNPEDFAEGGVVSHIPGPPLGAVYGRYAKGGKVGAIRNLRRRLINDHRSGDQQRVLDALDDEGLKYGLKDLAGGYYESEDNATAMHNIRKSVGALEQARLARGVKGSTPKMISPNKVKKAQGGLACLEY